MIPFKPVVEPKVKDAFLTESPEVLVRSGKFAQVPWIVGLNTDDGALRAAGNSSDFFKSPLESSDKHFPMTSAKIVCFQDCLGIHIYWTRSMRTLTGSSRFPLCTTKQLRKLTI